jgi:hypothetical protein
MGRELLAARRSGVFHVRDGALRTNFYHNSIEFRYQKIVETTTLEHLIDTFGPPCFVKIDVVGFELEVLQGLRRCVPLLSFEIDLPEFRHELLQCIEILGGLSLRGLFNYSWDRRNGFCLRRWLDAESFVQVLESCGEGPIEIYWRTPR